MVMVKDLEDQTGRAGPHPFLKCFECDSEYSSNKADYWNLPDNYVFTCCGEPMVLARRTIEDIMIHIGD